MKCTLYRKTTIDKNSSLSCEIDFAIMVHRPKTTSWLRLVCRADAIRDRVIVDLEMLVSGTAIIM